MGIVIQRIANNSETKIVTAFGKYNSVNLVNVKSSGSVEIDLYVKDVSNTRYFLRNTVIPNGSALSLSSNDISFDNETFDLYIISDSSGGDIDVILRN